MEDTHNRHQGLAVRLHKYYNLPFTNSREHADAIHRFSCENYGIVCYKVASWLMCEADDDDVITRYNEECNYMRELIGSARSNASKHYYPLNGKVFAEDGITRYGGNVNHSNGKRYFQYRCVKNSSHRSINADLLNEAVMYSLKLLLLSDVKNEELLKALNQYAAEMRVESNAECRTLKNKKAALENSRSHLMAVLESGKAKESILNRLDTIETELSEISKRIEQSAVEEHIFTDEDLKKLKKQFVPYMVTQRTLQAKNLLDAAVKKVTIGNDSVEIQFNHGVDADSDTIHYFKN